MTVSAVVRGCPSGNFLAELSDGRKFSEADLQAMARLLHRTGVRANGVTHEWGAGQRMLTAGQLAALHGEIRGLERLHAPDSAAAKFQSD